MMISLCVCQGKDGEIPEEDAATLAMDFDVGFAIKEKVYQFLIFVHFAYYSSLKKFFYQFVSTGTISTRDSYRSMLRIILKVNTKNICM